MKIWGIDTNTYFFAITKVEGGRFAGSILLPAYVMTMDAKDRKKKRKDTPSPRERLDNMVHDLEAWMSHPADAFYPDYVYIEEPPYVNSVKTFAELTAVVMVTRQVFKSHEVPTILVNVSTWKRETTGNAKADKTEVREWAIAHIPEIPSDLTEDEYDAAVIAFRGAVAAGDVKK